VILDNGVVPHIGSLLPGLIQLISLQKGIGSVIPQSINDELTLTGRGTPAGTLLRRYWQPAALAEELAGNRPVVPVTLLGEQLVLFREDNGQLGLISRHCPHRGADLCFGRLEDGGLRCPFHGWLFDKAGQCLEQPAEPADSRLYERIQTEAYPVVEKNGVIFAYLGPGAPPPFPAFDCFAAPESHVFAFKGLWECNWLQALEVGIDPAHASFLHRFLADEDPREAYGKQFRDEAGSSGVPMTQLLRDYPRPELRVEKTEYGMRIFALRHMDNGNTHVRITNQIFPQAIAIPISNEMTITQWHVPVDDKQCYWYSMFTSFTGPVDKDLMRAQRIKEHTLPEYRPIKNRSNNYGYDPQEQGALTYTGMGMDINVHDQWAVESLGAIQDRTREHLASTDVAISAYRRMLRDAIANVQQGSGKNGSLPMITNQETAQSITGPIAVDAITPADNWENAWQATDVARRQACPWLS
jgi:phthalate 4,5-dioxygenase oxygenase subunit